MKIRALIPTIAVVLLATGCPKSAVDGLRADLDLARAHWAAYNTQNYDMTVTQTCPCPGEPETPVRIKVRNGVITERTVIATGASVPTGTASKLGTVEDLHEYIEFALDNEAVRFDVEYEGVGYPYRIDITEIDGAQWMIDVTNFVSQEEE